MTVVAPGCAGKPRALKSFVSLLGRGLPAPSAEFRPDACASLLSSSRRHSLALVYQERTY